MNQLENVKSEEWRPIKEHEGLYDISNLGRVRNHLSGNILKASKNKTGGYYYIRLCNKKGERISYRLHRLVAIHYVDNDENLTDVNHIDEDKSNNVAHNLEWLSHIDNIRYGSGIDRRRKSRSKKIICSNGIEYESISSCARELKISKGSICEQLKGRRKSVAGYTFNYK